MAKNIDFRQRVCRSLRGVTRRFPSLYGFNAYLRWQRRWTPANDEYCVTDVDRTITMFLRPCEFVDFALFYQAHLYERSEQRVLWSQLKAGFTFVDVGAHVGFYTLMAAKRVGPEGRVFSFEPDPDTCRRLVRNVRANAGLAPKIRVFESAVSDREGVAQIYRTTPGNMGANTLTPGGGAPAMPVVTTTLDRMFADESIDPGRALVKIDAEGGELIALRGFQGTLSGKAKPVLVVEAGDKHLRRAGASSEQLVLELESFGYRLFEIHRGGLRPLNSAELPAFVNLLALPS
jgi:FkbM family methyltransferase